MASNVNVAHVNIVMGREVNGLGGTFLNLRPLYPAVSVGREEKGRRKHPAAGT